MASQCRARAAPFCTGACFIANRPIGLHKAAEYDLLRSCGSPDEQEATKARITLGCVYLQLIKWMAGCFDGLELSLCELTSAGIMGLNQAIHDHFMNPSSFRSHAFQHIQQAMINALMGVDQER